MAIPKRSAKNMSRGVHIQVSIPTSSPDKVQAVARDIFKTELGVNILDAVNCNDIVPGANEAYELLDDFRERRFFWKWGNQGDLLTWGMVGNHSDPLEFANWLLPLWTTFFENSDDFIYGGWEKILIIYSFECGDGPSGIIEIGWDDRECPNRSLIIQHSANASFKGI